MIMKRIVLSLVPVFLLLALNTKGQQKPNVVLIMMDNLGWGELGCYGGGELRGAPTPNIDQLASEGMRFLNFNVEAQCTPSRAATLTGRYAVRTGNASIPIDSPVYGLTQWEYTLAEMFSDVGYSTAMFGKWHLGQTEGRFPTDQGFDEWYGIPNSSDEAFWPDDTRYKPSAHPFAQSTYIMESVKGEQPKELTIYNLSQRAIIDEEITSRSVDFIKRQAKNTGPFFLFIPYTQTHMPTTPHPQYKGKTGNGDFADVLVQMDDYVGRIIEALDEQGLNENTILIFTSDNGPDPQTPYHGFSGPWRGSYFTGFEGSLRVPCIMRWPNKIPGGTVTNEIVHEMDLFPTLARIVGGKIPDDRIIDGVDQLDFLYGRQDSSNRESVIIYVGNEIFGVKWRNFKLMTKEIDKAWGNATRSYSVPLFYDLYTDPKEENPLDPKWIETTWMRWPAGQALTDHLKSLEEEPVIRPGALDPYLPE
ncbi:arylsulfatase [Cryomorphaceae bacterium]|nr:arylsulfatase [Cryomorphaceae bacterium]